LFLLSRFEKVALARDGPQGITYAIGFCAPGAAVAVFVGTEFDSVAGRGGSDGTPLRKTPWGEIAFQLGGADAFAEVAEHDKTFIEPKGDVIDKILPKNRPCLILMDEVLNYISTYRDRGYHNKLYNFLQSLSETVRGRENAVLVCSIPASELSYTDKDDADQHRLKNLLDRVGKAVIVSVETETSEIIRRRLFEWDEKAVTTDGRVLLSKEAEETCRGYGAWVQANRQQLPTLINPDLAREEFRATFPFHPMVISVFERKWQTLPRFQQTRGILRLLALWVSRAYQDGYKGAHRDPLITLGTAPLEDPIFRAAVFEQLGETKLEGAVTTDIVGKKDAHSIRLDAEAIDSIKKARLHRKVATTIFFESNGGQVGAESREASVPEIRLAVGEPDGDIGNIETVLEALTDACYYLNVEKTRYKFSLKENLNKRFSDRRATIQGAQIDEEVKSGIQKLFPPREFSERVFFPEKSMQISDRPLVTFVIGGLNRTMEEEKSTKDFVEQTIRECGSSARTFKNAVVWIAAESVHPMREEARKLLAWQAISESQKKQLTENIGKAKRDLKESIWRSYKYVLLLAKDNSIKAVDLGLVHSSSAETPISNILNTLSTLGDVEKGVGPNALIKHWPPAFTEWSTKALRDAFYASPVFPRVLNAESIKATICRGVESGLLAYVGKNAAGQYQPLFFNQPLNAAEVEFSDDMYVVSAETARAFIEQGQKAAAAIAVGEEEKPSVPSTPVPTSQSDQDSPATPMSSKVAGIRWSGNVPSQKWMNFYTKVLSRFAGVAGLKLTVNVEVKPIDGVAQQTVDDTKNALRELGLDEHVDES
jgi:hypothetical protein